LEGDMTVGAEVSIVKGPKDNENYSSTFDYFKDGKVVGIVSVVDIGKIRAGLLKVVGRDSSPVFKTQGPENN
jgi:hypothetical protein